MTGWVLLWLPMSFLGFNLLAGLMVSLLWGGVILWLGRRHYPAGSFLIIGGIILVGLSIVPLLRAVSSRQPHIPADTPDEVLKLAFNANSRLEADQSEWLVAYAANTITTPITFTLPERESLQQLWAYRTAWVAFSDAWEETLPGNPPRQAATWGRTIQITETNGVEEKNEPFTPIIIVDAPLSPELKHQWLEANAHLDIIYPSKEDRNSFEEVRETIEQTYRIFVISPQDQQLRLSYDAWKEQHQFVEGRWPGLLLTSLVIGLLLIAWGSRKAQQVEWYGQAPWAISPDLLNKVGIQIPCQLCQQVKPNRYGRYSQLVGIF